MALQTDVIHKSEIKPTQDSPLMTVEELHMLNLQCKTFVSPFWQW